MIEFKNTSKVYSGNKAAISNFNLKIEEGEFIVIIGTSGSGKTTCMRMINRMIEPSKGEILIDGNNIKSIDEVQLRRQIGYVIQQIGLMPHMTIYDNIVMVPKLLKWSEEKQRETAAKLIQRIDLPENFLYRYPAELSGGQQQRIGVIRALAADQKIILMDEPFGALDPITRDSLQELIKELQREMGKTIVFVTHDMDEALKLADKIVIMDQGEIIQFDTPDKILQEPANNFVREMIGEDRLNQAKINYQTVDKIMLRNPVYTVIDEDLRKAVKMMRDYRVDTLLITDKNRVLKGSLDIFNLERQIPLNAKIEDYIRDTIFIQKHTLVRDALYIINLHGHRNIPVVDHEQKLVGLVTRASIVDLIYDNFWGDYEPEADEQELVKNTNHFYIDSDYQNDDE